MGKPLKYGLFLLVLLTTVAVLLTLVNSFTLPVIESNRMKEVSVQLKELDPESEFKDISKDYTLSKEVNNVYGGYDGDKLVTVVYLTTTVGYSSGDINTLTAIDINSKTIINTKVTLADKQTAGIGDAILTHNFQTAGKNVSDYAKIVPGDLSSPEFQIISGATISSRAFLSGVQIASKHFMENFGG